MPVITNQLLNQGKSVRGSWSTAQLAQLGIDITNNSGWLKKSIGKSVTQEQIDNFIALKDSHLVNKEKYKHLFQEKLF